MELKGKLKILKKLNETVNAKKIVEIVEIKALRKNNRNKLNGIKSKLQTK